MALIFSYFRTNHRAMMNFPKFSRRFYSTTTLDNIRNNFFLSTLQPFSSKKNRWNGQIVQEIKQHFPETEIYEKEEDGMVYGLVSEGKNHIQFRGRTPLEAMHDLQEGLELLPDEALVKKVDAINKFVIQHIHE